MKRFIILAAMAAMTLTACQQNLNIDEEKPEGTVVFTASTELPATKTALDASLNVVWQDGDIISIVGGDSHVGQYQTSSGGATTATFTHYGDTPVTQSPFVAWYPTSLKVGSDFILPSTQNYVADNIAGNPMYAESSNTNLSFKNLCGIIRLNVRTSMTGKKVSKIVLSADQGMSGAFTISSDAAVVSGTDGVTLDCGTEGVEIGATAIPFYIAVPATDYENLAIKVETTDGLEQTKTLKTGEKVTVWRSTITDISLNFNDLALAVDLSSTTGTVTIPSGVNARLTGSKSDRTVIVEGSGSVITLEDASFVRLEIQGDATIVSSGTNTIYNSDTNPVFITEGNTATFQGDGTLNVTGYYCEGAIICENANATIIINSGTYNLRSGCGAYSDIKAGNLTITGGTVNATSYENPVGIYAKKTVSIIDGVVYARGTGIGIYDEGGDVVISGGTVTAEQTAASGDGPSVNEAGIVVHSTDGTTGGTLTISGGIVNAIGHIGPGIGGAWHHGGWSPILRTRSILISGGTVTASSDVGELAAIGFSGGYGNPMVCEAITITNSITSLTLIQGPTATRMITYNDSPAVLTVDSQNMSGYFTDPTSVDWSTLPNLKRTVTTTTAENDTWTFTPKP